MLEIIVYTIISILLLLLLVTYFKLDMERCKCIMELEEEIKRTDKVCN